VLTVVNGIQTATREAATTQIFAMADPAGQVFDRWTGDIGLLLTPTERQSGARTPAAASSVTATFRARPIFAYTDLLVKGPAGSATAVTARYYFPQSLPARGVVFRFHGSGGSAIGVTTGSDDEKLNRDLVADGYALVALDSNDRVNRQWENLTAAVGDNADTQNVLTAIRMLMTLGLVDAATRYFSVGHSNGGAFAPLVAYQLGWRACYVSCARGNQPQLQQVTTVPTIWTIAQNDSTVGADGNAGAISNFQLLSGRGVAAQFVTFVPSSVYASRFTQISGISAADSQAIYQSLKNGALLDTSDFQLAPPDDTVLARSLPTATSSYNRDIVDILRVAYAEHQFSAAASARVRSLFAAG